MNLTERRVVTFERSLAEQRRALSAAEANARVRAELLAIHGWDVEADAVHVIRRGSTWHATLRERGARVDEALCAAVAEIGRRLASGHELYEIEGSIPVS